MKLQYKVLLAVAGMALLVGLAMRRRKAELYESGHADFKEYTVKSPSPEVLLKNKFTRGIMFSTIAEDEKEYDTWVRDFHAKSKNYKDGVWYHGTGSFGTMTTVGDGLYLGKDRKAIVNFYNSFGEQGDIEVWKGKPKLLDLARYGDFARFKELAIHEFGKHKNGNQLRKMTLAMGYDGLRYYDPISTGDEFVIYNASTMNLVGKKGRREESLFGTPKTVATLLHGTSSANLAEIKKKGLLNPYLTDDEDMADYFATEAVDEKGGDAVVLKVTVDQTKNLRIDRAMYSEPLSIVKYLNDIENDFHDDAWHEALDDGEIDYPRNEKDWKTSLEVVHSVRYDGTIVPDNIDGGEIEFQAPKSDGLADVRPHTDRIYDAIVQAMYNFDDGMFSPSEVYYFGSRVRGNHGRDSDIDVFIVVDTDKPFDEWDVSSRFTEWFRMEGFPDGLGLSNDLDFYIAKREPKAKELPVETFFGADISPEKEYYRIEEFADESHSHAKWHSSLYTPGDRPSSISYWNDSMFSWNNRHIGKDKKYTTLGRAERSLMKIKEDREAWIGSDTLRLVAHPYRIVHFKDGISTPVKFYIPTDNEIEDTWNGWRTANPGSYTLDYIADKIKTDIKKTAWARTNMNAPSGETFILL